MIRKAMMLILTILSSMDIALLWTGSQRLIEPTGRTEINQVSAITTTSTGSFATGNSLDGDSAALQAATTNDGSTTQESWIALKPAAAFINPVTADGAIELVGKQQVVLLVDGVIRNVAVKVGDRVKEGDLLLALVDDDLARAVSRAELDVTMAQAELQKLQKGSSRGEIAVAQANLDAAKANLVKAQTGPSQSELDAAQSRIVAAQLRYKELNAPPSGAESDEVRAELEKAQIAVQTARRAYDAIGGSQRADIGMTPESQRLYEATVELERVQAKANRINQSSSQSSLQDAVSNIEKAQAELAQLQLKPSASEIADAQAKVSEAEERLNKLQAGASASELETAQAKLQKAQLDLDEAKLKLASAQVLAPIAGTVLEMGVNPGERGLVGKTVATLADTNQLKLTVKVAEIDVAKITTGQVVSITLDALPGRALNGMIESIAPTNQENKDVVNYPVTIRLTDANLEGVRPGMTAQAKLTTVENARNSWLAPKNSLLPQADGTNAIRVQRGETLQTVNVVVGEGHGEWIVVQSAALRSGDLVQGSVTAGIVEPGEAGS